MVFLDPESGQLLQFKEKATTEFWDQQWGECDLKEKVTRQRRNRLVDAVTKKYLAPGSRVLDAGCGIGATVHGLDLLGYDAVGIDTAENTVKLINQHFPKLEVSVQDVQSTDFPDESFDGCWSLGVIEHDLNGYDQIIIETHRILKPGGFLFLTFPCMSPLRRVKARFGLYNNLLKNQDYDTFYQFMLEPSMVIDRLKNFGFVIRSRTYADGTKGLKDEISFLKPLLQRIYNGKNMVAKVLNFAISKTCAPFAGHGVLLVCEKINKGD
ncbi:MAG: class I SAM-dependent methyltransferase [Parcubacteria group bacterium]|nr:class I SAM-dependent methyltransferase [Parcubacteria group bacterium]